MNTDVAVQIAIVVLGFIALAGVLEAVWITWKLTNTDNQPARRLLAINLWFRICGAAASAATGGVLYTVVLT